MELNEDSIQHLLTATGNAAHQWQVIGIHLGFKLSELRLIEVRPLLIPEGAPGFYREMIAQWLEWATPNHPMPTVEALTSALRKAGKERLALELEQKMKPEKRGASAAVSSGVGDTATLKSHEGDTVPGDVGPVYGCGCGHCTFVAFIETGCPQPTFTKSGRPFLDTSRLSDTEKEHLVGQLSDESDNLIFTFQDLVSSSCASFEKQGVTPAQLAMSLLTLGTLSPVYANPQVPLFHERSGELQSAQSIKAVFFVIHGYISFFHHNVLEHLIREFGTPEDKAQLESYRARLDDYCRHRLFECPPLYGHSCKTHHSSIGVKLDENLERFTLQQLKRFWSRFARHLRLTEYALRLISVEEGCMQLLFQVPSSATRQLFPLLREQEEALEEEKVIELVCGDYKFSSKTRSPPTATPTVSLALSEPQEISQQEPITDFDIIAALLDAGVPHIPQQTLCCLDLQSLMMSEAVSTLWRDVIRELPVWRDLIKCQLESNPVWRELFKKRGWYKYLEVPLSKQKSGHYRQLHQTAFKDICSLETNWRKGRYTLTKIETGSEVGCLQFDDNKIVTGHGDGTIKIWDRSTLQVLKVLKGHKNWVQCLQYNEQVVISGSRDHTVKVWDIETGQLVNELLHHKGTVYSLKFTTKFLITGSSDKTMAVWDIETPTAITLRTVLKEDNLVFAVELSETYIISGHRPIKVWDIFNGGLVRTLHGHSELVWSLQLRGSHLISGSSDKTIRIWNINSGECLRVLHGHDGDVMCVAMDDKRIISGSDDKTVKVWDLAAALDPGSSSDALCVSTLKEHTGTVRGLQFDDFHLITASYDKTIIMHDFLDVLHPIIRT